MFYGEGGGHFVSVGDPDGVDAFVQERFRLFQQGSSQHWNRTNSYKTRLKNEKNLKKDQNSTTKTSDCEQQIRKQNFIRIKNTVPLSSSVSFDFFFREKKPGKKILTNNTGRPVPNLIVLGFRELHHEFGNFVGWPHLLHDRSAVVGDGDITVRSHENFVETCREKKHPEISFQIQVLDVRAQKDYLLARGMCEECSKRFSRPWCETAGRKRKKNSNSYLSIQHSSFRKKTLHQF